MYHKVSAGDAPGIVFSLEEGEARSLGISQTQKSASKEKERGGGSGTRQPGLKSWFYHTCAV